MKTIVVGVDGSEGGNAALDYAAEEAALRGARLKIVTAWEIPPGVLGGIFVDPSFVEQKVSEPRERAEAVVAAAAARVAASQPSVAVEPRVVEGQDAKVLLEEASDATLIVVGSRGHGGFSGLLLGSVSQQVVNRAHCSVTVVRPSAGHEASE